jgi:hypothetical protein
MSFSQAVSDFTVAGQCRILTELPVTEMGTAYVKAYSFERAVFGIRNKKYLFLNLRGI